MSKMTPAAEQWSLYAAAQNLSAVLNDPNRGKQSNFFVKTWGESFVEKNIIDKSPFLPEITYAHFDNYLKKYGKRFKRHTRIHQTKLENNCIKTKSKANVDENIDVIPEIFLKSQFPLNDPRVFAAVFNKNENVLQEELSYYLDIVEVQIAKQVSQKSGAFFHAMTSHDTIMEQMGNACKEVAVLRNKVQKVDKTLAKDSLRLIGLTHSRSNHLRLLNKLKLMSTVLQTQPTLQLLLSSSDYVGALELIASTQEVLARDLAGVTSLRHLPSQLKEMSKLIDKMLSTEFEKYAGADLHRPLESEGVLEQEKLVSLVAGILRQNQLQFLESYKQEAITAVQTILKQLMIEQLADTEEELGSLTGTGEVAPNMETSNWLKVLNVASQAFGKLVQRVKAVHDVIKETANNSAYLPHLTPLKETFLTPEEHRRLEVKLKDLLTSVCDYCHERLSTLITIQSEKQTITANQINELSNIVENFILLCKKISGKECTTLRSAFKIQASSYILKFHKQRTNKLTTLLDAERWKTTEVPNAIQLLINELSSGNIIKSLPESPSLTTTNDDYLDKINEKINQTPKMSLIIGNNQNYVTVSTVLILIRLVSEYCVCAYNLKLLASVIGRNLSELLITFNSRSCQLVLGAGALKTAGLKTITTTNLALTSRSLQLVLWMIPHIKNHFSKLTNDPLIGFDVVEKDIGNHIQELETKVLVIMNTLLSEQLNDWDAKPPVPSKAFRNVSRHLTKLHEAVSTVLPEEQVRDIYETIHKKFKSSLREQLVKMNIQNNGGPQHGVVTTEIIFYLETLKNLKVLPEKYLTDSAMNDIWTR